MALSPSRGVSAYSLHQLTKRETGETGRCTGCCANSGPVPSKRISVRYKDSQVSVLCYHGTGAEEIRAHIVSRFHVKGGIYFVNNDGEDVVLSSSVPDGISLHLRITEPKAPYRKKVDSEWVLREKQRQGIGLLCSMTVAVAIMFVAIGIMTITTYMFMDQHEGNAVREWQFPLARCKRSLLEALHGGLLWGFTYVYIRKGANPKARADLSSHKTEAFFGMMAVAATALLKEATRPLLLYIF